MVRRAHPAMLVLVALGAVTSCSGRPDGDATATTPSRATPHGHVDGATEVADAQVGLAFASVGSDTLTILDLATAVETTVELELPAASMTEDGRFVYVGDGDRSVEIVDSGTWTVDHGDHVHYYRAPATSLGIVELDAPVVNVIGHGAYTAIGSADGTVTLIDRAALERGRLVVLAAVESDAPTPFAVPFDAGLLLSTATGIDVVDPHGERDALDVRCADPDGWAVLRSGVAIGCDDGVVIVKRPTGRDVTARLLPYPVPAPRATDFGHRPRSNEAAAVAGAEGVWTLDINHERLTFVPSGGRPVVAAASPADERHVLTLGADGAVQLVAMGDGAVVAAAALPARVAAGPIRVDVARAYVADADGRRAYELDYRDGLRVARAFELGAAPELLVEVGR